MGRYILRMKRDLISSMVDSLGIFMALERLNGSGMVMITPISVFSLVPGADFCQMVESFTALWNCKISLSFSRYDRKVLCGFIRISFLQVERFDVAARSPTSYSPSPVIFFSVFNVSMSLATVM